MAILVSEYEVLKATIVWLDRNGWTIESISMATGSGLPPIAQQEQQLIQELEAANIRFEGRTIFKPQGPDIVARSHEGIWKIECKGLGKGLNSQK